MGVIFIKELKALLRSLRGIICITVFTLASGIVFTLNNLRLAYPSIDAIIATLSIVSALIIPVAVGFGVSGERKRGENAFLAALPLTGTQMTFGKLLANTVFFLIPTAVVSLYPIILGFFGDPFYAYSYVAILTLVVFQVFVISFCMMLSALFKKSWLVLTVAYSALAVLFLLGAFSILFPEPIAVALRFISPFRRFDPIVYGRLDISSIVFYLLLSALFVFIFRKYYSVKSEADTKKFKLSLSCAILSAVVIGLSVATAFLPTTFRFFDVSAKKIYTLNARTESFIDSVDENVTLYLVDSNTGEEKLVRAIERYCDRSPRITLERVDTSKNTDFRSKYGFNDGADLSFCIVVEGEARTRIISADELFVWYNAAYPDFGYMSASELQYNIAYISNMLEQYSAYYSQMSSSDKEKYNEYMTMYQSLYYMSARYLNIENAINQAVEYVTADIIPTFYFATGHGEKNTTGGPLDLTAIDKIPDEAAMILINTPDTDYSDAQTDMLIEYVKGGGRVVLFTNESNNEMPNLMRLCKSVGLSIDADGFDDGEENKVTATVNTSSSIFSSLATNEKLTLDMTGTSAISYESVDSSLEYTSLFNFDIEQKDEKGETKVIGKDLGATVSKNGQPVFIWVSGSDTFNVSAADIGEDGREQYVIATQCLQYIVSSTRRAFTSSLEPVPAKEYDIATPLALEAGEVSLFGTLVIGIIPLALLGTGLLNIYLRKKRGSREGEQ